MNHTSEIKEEKEGAEHYRELAKKDPKNKSKFLEMSRDELKHKRYLQAMCKTKALKKITK